MRPSWLRFTKIIGDNIFIIIILKRRTEEPFRGNFKVRKSLKFEINFLNTLQGPSKILIYFERNLNLHNFGVASL